MDPRPDEARGTQFDHVHFQQAAADDSTVAGKRGNTSIRVLPPQGLLGAHIRTVNVMSLRPQYKGYIQKISCLHLVHAITRKMSRVSPFLNSGNLTAKLSNLSPEGITDEEDYERCTLVTELVLRLKVFRSFLPSLDDIQTEQDAKYEAMEFENFVKRDRPSSKVQLGAGLKKELEEVEGLMYREANRIIDVLKASNNWSKGIEELKQQSSEVIKRIVEVEGALEKYVTRSG
ncbi:unnamed protein product [Rhizoctonia solani]|nr:unnamed protein product [Rhizoctonia solani]